MALISFAPLPGLTSDDTTFSKEGRWATGDNVRFFQGRPQPLGGLSQLTGTGYTVAPSMSGTIRNFFSLSAGAIAIGTSTHLYRGNLSGVGDVSPGGAWVDSAEHLTFGAWGSTLLVLPAPESIQPRDTLYEQSGVSAATAVAGAPSGQCMLLTPERQVLIGNSNIIYGSDLEDYNDWIPTSDNNAFEHVLDGATDVLRMAMVGQFLGVWTRDALYVGQFLGAPAQTYRFDLVDRNCGIIGTSALTVHNGRAYWVGSDLQFRTWAPGELPRVIPCPVSKAFATDLKRSEQQLIHAGTVSKFQEVWFLYPRAGGTTSGFLAFSVTDGQWFQGTLNRQAMLDSANVAAGFASLVGTTRFTSVLMASGSAVYAHELDPGSDSFHASPAWSITSADFYIDNAQRRSMIRGTIPDFEDQNGDVLLTVFMRDRPQSAAVTKGPFTVSTSTSKKDFRGSGKVIAVKYSGAAGTYARLGKQLFDVVPMGQR